MTVPLKQLIDLLNKSLDHPAVRAVIGNDNQIERVEHLGYVRIRPLGIELVLEEAAHVLPELGISDPTVLYVTCVHLHSEGHDECRQYGGDLPNGISFLDSEGEITKKLGLPMSRGGGQMNPILNKVNPKWLKYDYHGVILHLQFNTEERLNMISLMPRTLRH